MSSLPVVAVTSGEPAGIGPELCLRLVECTHAARLVVLADRGLLSDRAAALGLTVRLRDYDPALPPVPGSLEVLHQPLLSPALDEPSTGSAFSSPSAAFFGQPARVNSMQARAR